MNTNHLKKFAQETRRKLLEQVGAKLNFVLSTDSAELREKTEQLKQLRQELSRTTKEQLIEKVAYTWFNRLMALRFLDANDYQPLGIRIITPKDGYTIPELLDEAKRGNISEELRVNQQKIYGLLDIKIPSTNPQNEAFKELLIATCNHLHTTFPFLFEKINDYTELLLPEDLTSDFSVVKDVREGMSIEDCKNVEIIGWLYQFYISEKKDEVFASKSKVKKEDIPAATQLFTPRWIVEYLVQNTLGKLWLQNRPKSRLREYMPYFIEPTSLTAEEWLKIKSPEEIKFADPASGSGHILVYAFELFTRIYEEEGYNTNDIPKLIIENNLYGFEIDERAVQLSGLALMMKASEYQRRALKDDLQPNILCFQDLRLNTNEIKQTLNSLHFEFTDDLINDLKQLEQSTNFGSLIIPNANKSEISNLFQKLKKSIINVDVFQKSNIDALLNSSNQLLRLSEKYHCIVANPPYMGGGNVNSILSEFININFPDSKTDLMTCFMERSIDMLLDNGMLGMINLPSWLFLSSFEKLRIKLIKNKHFDSLLHMGRGIFGIDWGSTAFIIANKHSNSSGEYYRLHQRNFQHIYVNDIRDIFLSAKQNKGIKIDFERYREEQGIRKIEELIDLNGLQIAYTFNQKDFEKIPTSPIGYWLSEAFLKIIASKNKMGKVNKCSEGIKTSDNAKYIRLLPEVNSNSISEKWRIHHKGGSYRKWYGNIEHCILWENDGQVLRNLKSAGIQGLDCYDKDGITWSDVTSGGISFRLKQKNHMFDSSAPSGYFEDPNNLYPSLGFLNCKIVDVITKLLNPTIHFKVGNFRNIPFTKIINSEINELVLSCITISKLDWNSRETARDFRECELIRINGQDLEETYDLYKQYWKNIFFQLHKNEEELNKRFIEIHELQGELSPDVALEDITILEEETIIVNRQLVFKVDEVFAQFISYSVGCMFGRYSLDKKGLILANQGESIQDYLQKVDKSQNECSFFPDEDSIIPILDEEWFGDDIVGKFHNFLKVTFGEKNFNKNIAFVEEQIGKDFRKYFIKDFYPDHVKRYKKRPIYWMFSSPKGSFNVLIYIHRYTPDTVSNILNKYLKEFIGKLNTRKEHLQHVQVTGSVPDKTKAIKEIDYIEKMLVELHEYERDILYPLATERIEIDLDDGVLVNYNKFGKAVKEVKGLNDSATKKKVKQFHWIDTSQIR
jgi:hypothetical protein